jgi:transcriptional regulator with XRE-family HTH domain
MPFHFATAHEIAQTLAQRLKVARLARGLTQAELATRAGVSVGTIRNLERDGDCAFVTVIKVAQCLRLEGGFEALFAPGVQSIAELTRLEDAKSKLRQRAPRKPRTPKAAP